jgi:hypothetical protein
VLRPCDTSRTQKSCAPSGTWGFAKTRLTRPSTAMSEPSAAKIDHPFMSDAEIDEMVGLFESCQLPGERWTHRAHLAVAATYLGRYPLTEAMDRARVHIRRYNESRGNTTGYHETITVLFMRLVARERCKQQRSRASLVNDLAVRCRVDWLLGYYSRERLWSAEARADFIAPDLRPLDF